MGFANAVAADLRAALTRTTAATFSEEVRFRGLWPLAYVLADAAFCRVVVGWANSLPEDQMLWAHNGLNGLRAVAAMLVLGAGRLRYLLRDPARELRWAAGITLWGGALCALVLGAVVLGGFGDSMVGEPYGFMTGWRLCADLVGSLLLAPLAEEPIHRGVLLLSLPARTPGWAAALASGVIFGVLHTVAYRQPGLPLFPLLGGVFTATALLARRSLWGPFVIHAAGNAFLIAADVMAGSFLG